MIRHLTAADYKTMPWANGRGQTVELIRANAPNGTMLWRLSMASVVEDGPFSVLPGMERNLTVISGPGFDLVGQTSLRAAPLMPVAFAGDVPLAAANVTAPSDDFNVMTARALPLPQVQVVRGGNLVPPPSGSLAIFALQPGLIGGQALDRHDLLITDEKARLGAGLFIAVWLWL